MFLVLWSKIQSSVFPTLTDNCSVPCSVWKPSIIYTSYLSIPEGDGTHPGWHWARGGVHARQVTSISPSSPSLTVGGSWSSWRNSAQKLLFTVRWKCKLLRCCVALNLAFLIENENSPLYELYCNTNTLRCEGFWWVFKCQALLLFVAKTNKQRRRIWTFEAKKGNEITEQRLNDSFSRMQQIKSKSSSLNHSTVTR